MRRIDQLLSEYGESHQHPVNKGIHWVCVPLIFFSVVGLVASIPSGVLGLVLGEGNPYAHWATVALALTLVYYISLSFTLSIGMAIFSFLCLFIAQGIAGWGNGALLKVSIGIFVLAWIVQFWGHKIEGKKPSFFKDIQFLLIGPAWLMHFVYKKIGIPY